MIDKGMLLTDIDGKVIGEDFDGKPRVVDGPDPDLIHTPDMGAFELVLGPVFRYLFVRGFCRHPDAYVEGELGSVQLDIGDPIYLLRYSFGGLYSEPGCLKACDADDSGAVNLTDAIYVISYLFLGSNRPPAAPFLTLGEDPSPDGLTCTRGKAEEVK